MGMLIPTFIYIPVWLDQKFNLGYSNRYNCNNLHSSMVRLEINNRENLDFNRRKFTFQYGQIRNYLIFVLSEPIVHIYIPVWLDQKLVSLQHLVKLHCYLHSSMVRLEIYPLKSLQTLSLKFTFQYGQIRNPEVTVRLSVIVPIYIPVWLDQK